MPLSRIDEIADAIVKVLESDTQSNYHADDILQVFDKEFVESLTGRHVYIMTDSFENPNAASRARDKNEYSFIIVGVERYPATLSGLPTKQWQRDCKEWFQTKVFDRVNDIRTMPELLTAAGLKEYTYPVRAQWVEVLDKEFIILHRLFWSEMTITFERIE